MMAVVVLVAVVAVKAAVVAVAWALRAGLLVVRVRVGSMAGLVKRVLD